MNTYVEKIELIRWITELQDVSVLEKIRVLKENTCIKHDLETISIENGLDDLEKGNVKSHLQVKKRYEKWLGN